VPVDALKRMGPQDAFVTVKERYGEAQFPARPDRFRLTGEVEHGDAATCAPNENQLDEYWFDFRDARRGFHVLVVVGHDAPPARREDALALLDSLRFETGAAGVHLDPTWRCRSLTGPLGCPGSCRCRRGGATTGR
jgi:hypothetical protein